MRVSATGSAIGKPGLPGVNAVPADEAVGTYIGTPGTSSRTAVNAAMSDAIATQVPALVTPLVTLQVNDDVPPLVPPLVASALSTDPTIAPALATLVAETALADANVGLVLVEGPQPASVTLTTVRGTASFVAGKFSSENGMHGAVFQLPASNTVLPNDGSTVTMTIEGWFYLTTFVSGQPGILFAIQSAGASDEWLAVSSTGALMWSGATGAAQTATGVTASLNAWHHYSAQVTYSSTAGFNVVGLWLDGSPATLTTSPLAIGAPSGGSQLTLGGLSSTSTYDLATQGSNVFDEWSFQIGNPPRTPGTSFTVPTSAPAYNDNTIFRLDSNIAIVPGGIGYPARPAVQNGKVRWVGTDTPPAMLSDDEWTGAPTTGPARLVATETSSGTSTPVAMSTNTGTPAYSAAKFSNGLAGSGSLILSGHTPQPATDSTVYTAEAWVKQTANKTTFPGVIASVGQGTGSGFWFGVDNSTQHLVFANGGGPVDLGSAIPQNGAFHHVAVAFKFSSSGVITVLAAWLDGAPLTVTGGVGSSGMTWTNALVINNLDGASNYPFAAVGVIDEVRVSGIARYTAGSSFTPPTAAFTWDADTLVLAHLEDANALVPGFSGWAYPPRPALPAGQVTYVGPVEPTDALTWDEWIQVAG